MSCTEINLLLKIKGATASDPLVPMPMYCMYVIVIPCLPVTLPGLLIIASCIHDKFRKQAWYMTDLYHGNHAL